MPTIDAVDASVPEGSGGTSSAQVAVVLSNGQPDLLWRNADSGNLALWLMDGVVRESGLALPGRPEPVIRLVGSGDFDGDGDPDLIWHDTVTGALDVWLMEAGTQQAVAVPTPSSLTGAWELAAIGDLDDDAKPDLLWRNEGSGTSSTG